MKHHSYPKDSIPHHLRCNHTGAAMRPLFCVNCTGHEVLARYHALDFAYRIGFPECSDLEFDKFESLCRELFPEEASFWPVNVDT